MKFSENWLREHVQVAADRDELAATLTAIGLEVEAVTPLGERLDGVVVGRIIDCSRHPQAERLQVCRVDAGEGESLQIVCGAPNARAGLVAPLAKVGAVLPGGMPIKSAELRGVASLGMLCSAKELGLDADASGLLELPEDAVPGTPLAEYLGLPDAMFELKLTPNRADCFSVRGIAFDVAAACGSHVVERDRAPVPATSDSCVAVELLAPGDAPRYVGRVIEGIDAARTTPVWIAERLRRSGVRPVSLLVDITQYVMLELGQPMHAYDLARLHGAVRVRRARDAEALQLLDGRQARLDPGFLVIADGERAIGLAGIMGGHDTRVGEGTTAVFLEAAHFRPEAIVGRARKLGLGTDAAQRFERGVDPELPRAAVEYATALILDLAGGRAGPTVETLADAQPRHPESILLRRMRLARVLGLSIRDAEVVRILRALGLDVTDVADGWEVIPPARRFDLSLEEDLIEEVVRIHGYDAIPATLPAAPARIAPQCSEARVAETAMREQLAARGYLEAINYAFVDAQLLRDWQADAGAVELANPLSAEMATMRTSLLPALAEALQRNASRQQGRARLFEIGKVFHRDTGRGDAAPRETTRIAAIATGAASAEQWDVQARMLDFHDLKGDLESLAALSRAGLAFEATPVAWAHPGRCARVSRDGAPIGWIAQIHPRLATGMGIEGEVFAFELGTALLAVRAPLRAEALSKFPSIRRDLAFVVAESTPWAAIDGAVREAAGAPLRDLLLFDRYAGPGVETGFKSLAMGLILQDDSRTLTNSEVDRLVAAVVDALAAHGAMIRH